MEEYSMNEIKIKLDSSKIEEILGSVTSPFNVLAELIKNSCDACSDDVFINVNNSNKEIIVRDIGEGFKHEDILKLGDISNSNKKIKGNIYNKKGLPYAGNKGLGLLSVFSICKIMEIDTENDSGERYLISWKKGKKKFSYEKIKVKGIRETIIKLKYVDTNALTLLSTQNEIKKLKHISIKNFIGEERLPNIVLNVDNEIKLSKEAINITDVIKEEVSNFVAEVDFEYENDNIYFQYISDDKRINNNRSIIKLENQLEIEKLLENEYRIIKIEGKNKLNEINFAFNKNIKLPKFSGKFYIIKERKTEKFNKFGQGVRIYINYFALYNYLDETNDWLGLSQLSQTVKNTDLRLHNILGYVHLEDYNENSSKLKISNERADFKKGIEYRKFEEIMKNVIVFLAFNINVASKNKDGIKDRIIEERKQKGKQSRENEQKGKIDLKQKKKENNKNKILKTDTITKMEGEIIDLKGEDILLREDVEITSFGDAIIDDNIFTNNNIPGYYKIVYKIVDMPVTEVLAIKINQNKSAILHPKKKAFFGSSHIYKGNIGNLEFDDLIIQLNKLKYEDGYLLYNMAFRTILEETYKKLFAYNKTNIEKDMDKNILKFLDQIDAYLLNKNKDIQKEKIRLKILNNDFSGYNELKNFLGEVKSNFKDKNSSYMDILNSYVHTPRNMDYKFSLYMANDVILPLVILTELIINNNL